VNWGVGVDASLDLRSIHVRGVRKICGQTVIFTDYGIEHIFEIDVRILVTCVDTTVLIAELHGTCNGLSQSKSRGLGLNSAEFLPFLLSHVLSNQTVG